MLSCSAAMPAWNRKKAKWRPDHGCGRLTWGYLSIINLFLNLNLIWNGSYFSQGQFFSAGEGVRIYLLGNPIIWWGNLVFMGLYLFLYLVSAIREKRGSPASPQQLCNAIEIFNWLEDAKIRFTLTVLQNRALHACGWLYVGWLLHYVPFWGMGRILYFHHYFPALLFSSMLSGDF